MKNNDPIKLEPWEFGDFPNDDRTQLSNYKIDLTNPVPDPHPLLSLNGVMFASPANLNVIKGGAKSAKSFLVSIIVAVFISGRTILGIKAIPIEGKTKVVILDTEQSISHVHKLVRRIMRLAGLPMDKNNPNLDVYHLKEMDTQQRFDALRTVVTDPQAGIIILDGAVDIIFDFNDIRESTEVRDELMQLVSVNQIALFNIIHTNKRDANSRGHFGAMLEQKSETTLQLSKEKDIFTVSGAYTRNAPLDDIQFIIDGEGMPQQLDVKQDKQEAGKQIIINDFRFTLSGHKLMEYGELVTAYAEVSGKSYATAKRHIGQAVKSKWIIKSSGSYSYNTLQDA